MTVAPLPPPTRGQARPEAASTETFAQSVPSHPVERAAEHGDPALHKNLLAGHADGSAYGAMVGLGETYLPAFALAAGLGEITAGLVSSVPLVAGGVMQLISPAAIRRLGSNRRWVMLCATLQALSFLPLVVAAAVGSISAPALLLVATFYWGSGMAAGPAWNTWMGTIVPPAVRARFFAYRTRISQVSVLIGFLAGGWALHSWRAEEHVLMAFMAIFLAAGACRLLSVFFLGRQTEPRPIPGAALRIELPGIVRQFRDGHAGRLLLYLVGVQSVVQFAGPYFTPFMFEKLKLSYGDFVALIAVSFMAKILCLPMWGRVAGRIGAFRLLWIGGIGIVPVSGMWLVSDSFYWLVVVQLVGGIGWAAYELAFFLQFFESIPESQRTSVLTVYNLVNTVAWVGGALAGGAVLYSLAATREAYLLLFGLSTVGRGLALFLLWRVPAVDVEGTSLGVRTVGVRPQSTAMDHPILPSLPDAAPQPQNRDAA